MGRFILNACIGIFALAYLLLPTSAASASAVSNNALQVSPSIVQIQLQPGQQTASYVAKLTNLTGDPLYISLSSRDFGALNESGNVSFYGKGYNPSTNPHGLQRSVSFSNGGVIVSPNSSQLVTVQINNVNKLAAGGHFGAALFSPSSVFGATNKSQISLHSSVASLIFLTTASGGTQNLQLLPFKVGSIRFSMPSTNYIVFKNSGNTQATPRGQLTLFNPRGQIMATQVINPGSGLILPGGSRLFQTNLPVKVSKYTFPGVYKLELQYKEANNAVFMTQTSSFLYLSWWEVIPGLVILVLAVVLLVLIARILTKLHFKFIRIPGRRR